MTRKEKLDNILEKLSHSKFRMRFQLKEKDIQYIQEKGMDTILKHTEDFVRIRLAPIDIPNDGKQTPMRGHPVFIMQHRTATCCRSCLEKWHHIPKNKSLTKQEQNYIIALIMYAMKQQIINYEKLRENK